MGEDSDYKAIGKAAEQVSLIPGVIELEGRVLELERREKETQKSIESINERIRLLIWLYKQHTYNPSDHRIPEEK